MALSDRAILVHLTISIWQGTVGRAPEDDNNLDPDRDRIIHSVVPKNMLEEINMYGRALRRRHYKQTAPWDDNGLRLVPSQLLLGYTNEMRECRAEFDRRVVDLIPRLEQAIEPKYAARFSDLPIRFGTQLTFYPVPDGDKMPLMVDTVDAAVRDSIVKSMTADTNSRMDVIVDGLLQSLKAVAVRIDEMESRKKPTTPAGLGRAEELYDTSRSLIKILIGVDAKFEKYERLTTKGLIHSIGEYRNGKD